MKWSVVSGSIKLKLMQLTMPQFAPMFSVLLFSFLWLFFCFVLSILWWASKRSYNF
ncbi:ATP synthase F0 subunit 8 (mitochondrion) [Mercenaria mercenaria]|uniref:ATP synthase F0 subunit 8 n=1 Tax=Mercenaria mercenaria TaxID=6596 RepID=A0A6H0JQB2_MERMC|nr:ATP synthase F0 subunit 8 [Mercenaria mercenaria]QIU83221.1 ATP synthase F0 subunit 8 [Mercenaria mercenaria]